MLEKTLKSDHDERDEQPATDVNWDHNDHDALTAASEHLKEFKKDGVALSPDDWDAEEAKDDLIPDHINAAVDASLHGTDIEDADSSIDPSILTPDEE